MLNGLERVKGNAKAPNFMWKCISESLIIYPLKILDLNKASSNITNLKIWNIFLKVSVTFHLKFRSSYHKNDIKELQLISVYVYLGNYAEPLILENRCTQKMSNFQKKILLMKVLLEFDQLSLNLIIKYN